MNLHADIPVHWASNFIIADGDYLDQVAFSLTVNFERMIGRRIHKADMAQWAVCAALDGGLKEGKNETQVVLIHDKANTQMENFVPSVYDSELNNQAFNDPRFGEFGFSSYVVEPLTSKAEMIVETLEAVIAQKEMKRIIVVPNAEEGTAYDELRSHLRKVDDEEKHVTVLTMVPREGGNFRQEMLGYSLMSALGIKSDELK